MSLRMPIAKFHRIAIYGVGLLGGSLGLAIQKRRLAAEVIGIGRNATRLAAAKRLKAVTHTTTSLSKGIADCDLAIVCTPVERIVETVQNMAEAAKGPLLITDVGSTKAAIAAELDALQQSPKWPPAVRFIGSHPIAGNEKQGAQHGSADLFVGRTVVVTPSETTKAADLRTLKRFWSALDARVTTLTPDEHDRAMAAVSHLPHLVASAIAAVTPARYLAFTGTGWKDTTRIAAGDPELWRQILHANRDHLQARLADFAVVITAVVQALQSDDPARLEQLLSAGKRIRDAADDAMLGKSKLPKNLPPDLIDALAN